MAGGSLMSRVVVDEASEQESQSACDLGWAKVNHGRKLAKEEQWKKDCSACSSWFACGDTGRRLRASVSATLGAPISSTARDCS